MGVRGKVVRNLSFRFRIAHFVQQFGERHRPEIRMRGVSKGRFPRTVNCFTVVDFFVGLYHWSTLGTIVRYLERFVDGILHATHRAIATSWLRHRPFHTSAIVCRKSLPPSTKALLFFLPNTKNVTVNKQKDVVDPFEKKLAERQLFIQ
jgi:hypothetical protein